MILSDDILNRILKNKIYKRESVNTMYKYALLDKKENLIEDFENDINLSNVKSIQKEIDDVCDLDNVFKFSEFEIEKKENLENQKNNFRKLNYENIDLEHTVVLSQDFVPEEIIDKYNILLSDLKKQIKSLKFKIFYNEIGKRQEILNSNISKAVKYGEEIELLKAKLDDVIHDFYKKINEINDVQKENCDKYLCMLDDFSKEKKIPQNVNDLINKYSEFVLNRFILDKLFYLITSNFNMMSKVNIAKAIANDEFLKNNYGFIYDELKRKIADVGADS